MTAERVAPVIDLPRRPAAGTGPKRRPNAQASPRARAREAADETPAAPHAGAADQAGVAATPRAAAPAAPGWRERVSVPNLPAVFTGASLLAAQPPSLAAVWAKHSASARYYSAGALRWPRYVFGAAHVVLLAPAFYFLAWVTDSLPKAATFAGVFIAGLLALHII